jgi:hypothetical protein
MTKAKQMSNKGKAKRMGNEQIRLAELAELRAKAVKDFYDHENDMANNPSYRAWVEAYEKRRGNQHRYLMKNKGTKN